MSYPIGDFITERMLVLGLDRESLGRRLGYSNAVKAAGRVQALCDGFIDTGKSVRALHRLPAALEVSPEDVGRAVAATRAIFAERERQRQEQIRSSKKAEEAAFRADFEPHGFLHTQEALPSSITMFAISGGEKRWLIISIDSTRPPLTYAAQALKGLPETAKRSQDGNYYVPFFGRVLGYYVNYTPDRAIRYDLEGNPIEVLPRAYRLGRATFQMGE